MHPQLVCPKFCLSVCQRRGVIHRWLALGCDRSTIRDQTAPLGRCLLRVSRPAWRHAATRRATAARRSSTHGARPTVRTRRSTRRSSHASTRTRSRGHRSGGATQSRRSRQISCATSRGTRTVPDRSSWSSSSGRASHPTPSPLRLAGRRHSRPTHSPQLRASRVPRRRCPSAARCRRRRRCRRAVRTP